MSIHTFHISINKVPTNVHLKHSHLPLPHHFKLGVVSPQRESPWWFHVCVIAKSNYENMHALRLVSLLACIIIALIVCFVLSYGCLSFPKWFLSRNLYLLQWNSFWVYLGQFDIHSISCIFFWIFKINTQHVFVSNKMKLKIFIVV